MKTGKLIAWGIMVLLSLSVCQAYGAYILKNNGELWIDSASLYIDGTPVNTYIASVGNYTGLNPANLANHTSSGSYSVLTVGVSVTIGQVLYINSTDGKLWKASATDNTTTPAIVIVMETITADNAGNVLNQGYIRDDTWTWITGGILYLSETPGEMTQTPPTGTGKQVQILGYALTEDIIYFSPNLMILELS